MLSVPDTGLNTQEEVRRNEGQYGTSRNCNGK